MKTNNTYVKKVVDVLKDVLPKLPKEKQEYIVGLAEGMELARNLNTILTSNAKEPAEEKDIA